MRPAILAGLFACCAFAQPDVIRVVRQGSIQPYLTAKADVDVVGASAVSGYPETWLFELHNSFASLEDLDGALNAARFPSIPAPHGPIAADEVLPPSPVWIARFRPELSYRPDQAMSNLARARYLEVTIYRLPAGAEADFAKVQELRQFSLDSINSDRPDMAYQVVAGAPWGTLISLTPFASLRSLDEGRRAPPVYAQGAAADARKLVGSIGVARERFWFRLDPSSSYVSEEFASPDPDFWHPPAK
jgi:hypothetical protein